MNVDIEHTYFSYPIATLSTPDGQVSGYRLSSPTIPLYIVSRGTR